MNSRRKEKQVTDLDIPDIQIPTKDSDLVGKKHHSNLWGNIEVTQSGEWELPKKKTDSTISTDVETVQQLGKDKQMESLIERIAVLYKYNSEFAKENKKLLSLLKKAEEKKNAKTCETCSQVKAERKELALANNSLQNDVAMMKILVYRLNVQIENYQDKLRRAGERVDDDIPQSIMQERKIQELAWGPVNHETLGPLLNSYEEMIRDKNDLIQQHENELKHFTGEFKKIVDENLRLQEEFDIIKKGSNGWLETKTRLQSQVESLRSKLDIQTKRADLAKEKLLEVIQCYEQKTQTLTLDLEHLQTAYSRCRNELVAAKGSKPSNQNSELTESLKECKALFEKLKSQHTKEKTELESKIEALNKDKSDLLNTIDDLKMQYDKMKNEKESLENLKDKTISMQKSAEKIKKSREKLKARLKIAIDWAKKLEQEHMNNEHNWDAVKRLEIVVKHKEAQLRGLHKRHLEEMENMQQRMHQKEETIKNILKSKSKIRA